MSKENDNSSKQNKDAENLFKQDLLTAFQQVDSTTHLDEDGMIVLHVPRRRRKPNKDR